MNNSKLPSKLPSNLGQIKITVSRSQLFLPASLPIVLKLVQTLTTFQTISGVATINAAPKIQLGISRIQCTTVQTQVGISRIQITAAAKIQIGISRIQGVSSNKIQIGISRIQCTTVRTQVGISRIQITASAKTQIGYASIAHPARTIIGISSIQNTTIKTQICRSRISPVVVPDWAQFTLSPTITAYEPNGSTYQASSLDLRISINEYLSGINYLKDPRFYYAPYDARHLNVLMVDTIWQNRWTQPTNFSTWVIHTPIVAQYEKIGIVNFVTNLPVISSITGTLAGLTYRSYSTMSLDAYHIISTSYLGFVQLLLEDNTKAEWLRYPLFVDDEIDFIQIGNTIGFTASGIAAIAGNGIVGRDKEEYVTLGVLTNVISTQETLEILATGNPSVDVTQVCFELIAAAFSAVENTQTALEVLYLVNIGVIDQIAIESLSAGTGGSGIIDQVSVEVLQSIKSRALVTQVVQEELQGPANPSTCVPQISMELLTVNPIALYSTGVIDQVAIEAIGSGLRGNACVDQISLEALRAGLPSKSQIDQIAIEIVHNDTNRAQIEQVTIEEINNSTTMKGIIAQIAIEILVKPEPDYTVASLVNNPRYSL